jgi:hypothetical protein
MSEEHGYRQAAGDLPEPESGTDESIGLDCLFSLLSNERRRYALYCCADRPASDVATSTLVDDVVELEPETPEPELQRREIAISLRHTHLPKLSEAAVIDYDPDESEVVYRGGARIDRWLESIREIELSSAEER